MSYGIDFPDLFRHAGDDVAEILGGLKPGDISFYQQTRYELQNLRRRPAWTVCSVVLPVWRIVS
jgi:hypothetical protein